MSPDRLPHRGRAWLLGVAVPVAVTVAAWIVIVQLLPRVPEPVALHWGPSGVDRTGTIGELLVPMAVISAVSLLVLAALSVLTGRQSFTRRMVLGLATGMATLFAGISLVTVAVQVDAPTAVDAASPDRWLAATIALATVLGVTAGALAGADPARPATGALPPDTVTTPLAEGERAVWLRSVTAFGARTTMVVVVLGAVLAVGLWLLADTLLALLTIGAALVLLLAMTAWEVRVDSRGLTARGTFGWPRMHLPADEVKRAQVTQVRPFPEFGGWGLRTNVAGTVGVVVRTGDAIAVERTGGRRFVVTVDDAASGAALLNTYAERARSAAARRDHHADTD